jgi:hypothetical protein
LPSGYIYCNAIKLFPEGFNSEHVISQLFGMFGVDTMTLNDIALGLMMDA